VEDLVAARDDLIAPLDAALMAARALPAPGWAERLGLELPTIDGEQANPTESFLRAARQQAQARVQGDGEAIGAIECDLYPVGPELPERAAGLARALQRLATPLKTLMERLAARLEDEAEELDEATRTRIEAACRSLKRRAVDPLSAWGAMLAAVGAEPPAPGERPEHVLFLRLDRRGTEDRDVGLHRHWLDPTIPFAATLARPAQGLLVTSATLRDAGADDVEAAWADAEARVGATHLPSPAIRVAVASPFDYAAQTRCFVVTDVNTREIGALAAAYRTLFTASGGGGLGLFTAIARLRAVHQRIAGPLEEAGIPLLAQHVDAMDNATLVDVFRTEEDSCLLGTDAMRDGVDVPGRALRLVVFERVPWPRPDILHRERRVHLSGGDTSGYDTRLARFRLRQAFGRLIRAGTDRGAFVLLDRSTPTRLLSAFPVGVAVQRVGLADAAAQVREFLG
jgi:ATP-dependent DNA helicase DinG